MGSGDSFNTLAARFRMGVSTVHDIIRETCDVIWEVLSPMELPELKARDWKRIADDLKLLKVELPQMPWGIGWKAYSDAGTS